MDQALRDTVAAVRAYWDSHPLGYQYYQFLSEDIEVGSPEFFEKIRPWMNPYKFPWIMDRIDRESKLLQGKHLLEISSEAFASPRRTSRPPPSTSPSVTSRSRDTAPRTCVSRTASI